MSLENQANAAPTPSDFIRDLVAQHVAEKKYPQIHTAFRRNRTATSTSATPRASA